MNIPAPQSKSYNALWERVKITIVALLVPEWVLGWAIRQCFMAGRIAKKLQEASTECRQERARAVHEELLPMDAKERNHR